MATELNDSDLRKACFDIARTTSWEQNDPQATSLDAIAIKAEQYREIESAHAEHLKNAGVDVNVLVSAVSYLSVHAIPPMGADMNWFSDMLDVLIQLFAPNFELGGQTSEFLITLRNAIDRNLS